MPFREPSGNSSVVIPVRLCDGRTDAAGSAARGAWRGPEKGRLDWCQAPRKARPSWLCVHGAYSEVRAKKKANKIILKCSQSSEAKK